MSNVPCLRPWPNLLVVVSGLALCALPVQAALARGPLLVAPRAPGDGVGVKSESRQMVTYRQPVRQVEAVRGAHKSPLPLAKAAASTPHADLVNPFVGTGGLGWGVGSMLPGATRPYGMVKLSPETTTRGVNPGFNHCGGYWYPDTEIRGFTHNHLSGTGVTDQGNILFMPLIDMTDAQASEEGYRSSFSKETEKAEPGYYAVTLDDGGIRVELTATERVGLHRYSFPASNVSTILIDPSAVEADSSASEVTFEILPDEQEVVGSMVNHGPLSGRYGGQRIFFSAYFRTPFERFGVFSDGHVYEDRTTIGGESQGAWLQYTTTQGQALEVAVGISYVSLEQARLNRALEATDWDFDVVRTEAKAEWERLLSRVHVEGGTEDEQRTFYSALYHSMFMPTLYTDANGLYMGFDGQTHLAEGFDYYTDMSMWDTFRTLHPLLSLIDADRQADFNTSMLKMYEQSGYIDRWPQGNGATGCMVGDPAAIVLAHSVLNGVEGFDREALYEALRGMAFLEVDAQHRGGLETYLTLGYYPVESGGRNVSNTLEYAYADGALSQYALAMGEEADAEELLVRAGYYRNHWNPETGFLQGRHEDGTWLEPFNPYISQDQYAEGDSWQWVWYAPHDIAGLIALFGGEAAFERALDTFFGRSERRKDTLFPDLEYWHGNEPDLHAAWLYNYVGRPDKTQRQLRWVLSTKYANAPDGLDGNDDAGTLSAWYVLASLGIYPIAGTDVYLVGSPLFSRGVLNLKEGSLEVLAPAASATNLYVQAARLNGQTLNRPWFRYAELEGGATLELTMGPTPSSWAAQGERPPSLPTGL